MKMQKTISTLALRAFVPTLGFMTILAMSGVSFAQNVRSSVDRHFRPEGGFFETQRSSRGINHARDYARDFYRYSSPRPAYQYTQGVPVYQYPLQSAVVSAPIMKSESQWLGQTIVGAQQHVTALHEQFKGSPKKLECVKTIEQHLTKAAELQKELHVEWCKQIVDGMVGAKCCSSIVKELDKAAAERETLVRETEIDAHARGDHGDHPPAAIVK